MAPCANHLRKSPMGKPELVGDQIEETGMKQISDLAREEQHGQTSFIHTRSSRLHRHPPDDHVAGSREQPPDHHHCQSHRLTPPHLPSSTKQIREESRSAPHQSTSGDQRLSVGRPRRHNSAAMRATPWKTRVATMYQCMHMLGNACKVITGKVME